MRSRTEGPSCDIHATVTLPQRRNTPEDNIIAHNQVWKLSSNSSTLNGPVTGLACKIQCLDGTFIQEGAAPHMFNAMDCFMAMMPVTHLARIVELTNDNLLNRGSLPTTTGEILRFFGGVFVMTRVQFGNRCDLWRRDSGSEYLPSYNFGKAMARSRFELLRSCIRFSKQDATAPVGPNAKVRHQWQLCDDFKVAFNAPRQANVFPSEHICVDESMSRWYGLCGSWIGIGSPHFVVLDRKPESGMEIQNIACGSSGILLGLKIVKRAAEPARTSLDEHNNGTNVLVELAAPWNGKERIICADSHFASVDAAEALPRMNLRFTGVVKSATSRFPIGYLNRLPMYDKGDSISLITNVTVKGQSNKIGAISWLDRNRRTFVTTCRNMQESFSQTRTRWHQFGDGACPTVINIEMPRPVFEYFDVAGIIDQHNRVRQDSLNFEKSI